MCVSEADFPTPPVNSPGEGSMSARLGCGGSVLHVRVGMCTWPPLGTRCWRPLPRKALLGYGTTLGDRAASAPPLASPWPARFEATFPMSAFQEEMYPVSEEKGLSTSSEFFLHFVPLSLFSAHKYKNAPSPNTQPCLPSAEHSVPPSEAGVSGKRHPKQGLAGAGLQAQIGFSRFGKIKKTEVGKQW